MGHWGFDRLRMPPAGPELLLNRRKIVVISNDKALRAASWRSARSWLRILAVVVFPSSLVLAQKAPAYIDPQFKAALSEISAGQIQSDIEKLVSFQTRSTISAQDSASISAGRGVGAAREWIKGQFERYSRDCGGCLEVTTDTFDQPVSERVPEPVGITDVFAVLKGTDPTDTKRIVLVTGHYDSRNSDPLDKTGFAPGANDDGSGTAVSLECARVLSKLKFPGTIIFLTVAGEEQGLYGSKHVAELAKAQGWQIEAVLNNEDRTLKLCAFFPKVFLTA